MEAQTISAIFRDNVALCNEISEKVVQHAVHCIETHGQHVEYLRLLQTLVRAENTYVRKCQDLVMSEVRIMYVCTSTHNSYTYFE